ncbi:MAG: sigma factor-like helix-turn-helix DNA-binding protein [bacterium]
MASYTEIERLEILEFLDEEGILQSYDDPIIRVELKELLENLGPIDRKVMILKAMGYTSQEIANFLGISRRRIRQRLIKIKKMIAEYIG